MVSDYFGSWGKAVEVAGIDYIEHRKTMKWSAEKVIEKIKYLYDKGVDLSDCTVNHPASTLYGAALKSSLNELFNPVRKLFMSYAKNSIFKGHVKITDYIKS